MRILYRAVTALVLVAFAGAANAQTLLRYAHTLPVSDPAHRAALLFKERVEERTNRALRVEIFPAGVLGSDPAMLDGVRLGTIDFAVTGSAFYARFEPTLIVVDLPFLFDTDKHAYQVLGGDVGRQLLDPLDRHRMKGLAFWEVGFRHLTNSRRPVRTVDDIKGLKIRTTPNPAHVKAFTLLGAVPTPLPWTETYTALETGAIDAQENPLTIIASSKIYEVQRHLTLTRHAYISGILSMNAGKWNALNHDQQRVVVEAAAFAGEKLRGIIHEETANAIQFLRGKGMEIVEEFDAAPLRTKVKEVEEDYVGKYGEHMIRKIRTQ